MDHSSAKITADTYQWIAADTYQWDGNEAALLERLARAVERP